MIASVHSGPDLDLYQRSLEAVIDVPQLDTQPFKQSVEKRALLYPSGPVLSQNEFEAVAEAAIAERDTQAFYVTLEGGSKDRPWLIDLTWADYKEAAVEFSESVLFSVNARWGIAWMEDEVTVLGGSTDFVRRIVGRLGIDPVAMAEKYLADSAADAARFGLKSDSVVPLLLHVLPDAGPDLLRKYGFEAVRDTH